MNRRGAVMAVLAVSCMLCRADVRAGAASQAGDARAEIEKLEHELELAIVRRDAEAIRRIEAEGYVHTDSESKVMRRDDFLRAYQSGANPIKSLKVDDLQVDLYGDAAVVRGTLAMEQAAEGGSVHRTSRYTRFYVRFPQGWQAVAGHSSPLK